MRGVGKNGIGKFRSPCNERGFTLPELTIVIAVMGILAAITVPMWWSVVDGRRVDSATNQVAADMRLAHSTATNRLAPAKIIFRRDGFPVTCGGSQADYCLVRPTPTGSPQNLSRYLPDSDYSTIPVSRSVKLASQNIPVDASGTTSTIQFNSDGSAQTLGSAVSNPVLTIRTINDPATTSCAVSQAKPCHDVAVAPATSRVQIGP